MTQKTIQSLWIHIACYVPMICLCVWAYYEPLNTNGSPQTVDCYKDYKTYLLVCGFAMALPLLVILYIIKSNSDSSIEEIEKKAGMTLGLECFIFSALYIYKFILQEAEGNECEGTGTDLGAIVMVPIYISSATCTLFGGLVLGTYLLYLIQICFKQVCCCCLSGAALMGSSLAKIPYIEHYFITCTDSCAICLSEFKHNEIVSPLHCDIKHVFHTECIKAWLLRNPICPLCKAEIDPIKLKDFNRNAVRQLKRAAEELEENEAKEKLLPKPLNVSNNDYDL